MNLQAATGFMSGILNREKIGRNDLNCTRVEGVELILNLDTPAKYISVPFKTSADALTAEHSLLSGAAVFFQPQWNYAPEPKPENV